MKKLLLYIALFFFAMPACFCQNWNFLYGGSEENWCRDVIETYDHGYVFVGPHDGQYSSIDIKKIDINGNILWQKIIGISSDKILPVVIIETLDKGFLIAGLEAKYDPPPVGGNSFAMKLNECGEAEWCKSYGTYGTYDYITKAVQTDDKGFAMIAAGIDNNNVVLLKTDSIGRLEFKKHYHDTSNTSVWSLIKCMNGDLILSGDGYFQNPGGVPAGWWERGIVTRVDKNGNEKWTHILGLDTLLFSATTYCAELPDSSIICGTTWRSQSNGSVTKPYIFELNKNGALQWRRFVGDTAWFDSDVAGIVQTDTNKVFLLSGRYCDPVYHGVFLYRTDTCGIFQDSAWYDYDHYCWVGNLKTTSDHKLIYCGTQDNGGNYQAQIIRFREDLSIDTVLNIQLTYDSLCGHAIPAIEYLPFDTSYHIGIKPKVVVNEEPFLFPNPNIGSYYVRIPFMPGENARLEVYDFSGRVLYNQNVPMGGGVIEVNMPDAAPGVYLCRVMYKGEVHSLKFVIN
ncbi:MAG: T9SS type A sorting domain-containing protein [Bacteroidota bacterium]